ncbi:Acetyltransferase (GNAT) domain-containing protein [Gracilibacillus ureilyticus]|uniref:Acetyltransferase (GNAT) domain-containing protein n=1 Tax=Gracilibacillus ureilyticus TaxID=531814 RepID=A0A1H9VBN2_9BACI|nr:GNAT family N-acetyltransferase [Gracilibacillus ureilyticus]SES18988.1 Acetyltransferase (GNAT) domain-containing protein [Gracilibacillus ureilyticus]
MITITKAKIDDLDKLVDIDNMVIGSKNRRNIIQQSIQLEQCLISKEEEEITGFLIYDTNFFECAFISLIIVSPSHRRKGFASALINYMVTISPTNKIFSSSNRSNVSMHKVFEKNEFIRSGIIENLDEGDPEIIYFNELPTEVSLFKRVKAVVQR